MVYFIAKRLIQSIFVMLAVAFLAFSLFRFVGIPAGVYTALRPRGVATQAILMLTLVGVSIPTFVIGIMLIFSYGVKLGWRPTFGRGGTVNLGGWETSFLTIDGWRGLILPAITLGVYQLTLTMRLVRAEMMEVMQSDYIRFATARGVPMRRLYFKHALASTMVPVITIIGLQFGGVIALSIVTESVFQWTGMGLLFLESIRFVDIPVMGVYLVVIAFFFVLVNLIVDLASAILLEATLSFFGIGLPADSPSLGTLIRIGMQFLLSGEWWIL